MSNTINDAITFLEDNLVAKGTRSELWDWREEITFKWQEKKYTLFLQMNTLGVDRQTVCSWTGRENTYTNTTVTMILILKWLLYFGKTRNVSIKYYKFLSHVGQGQARSGTLTTTKATLGDEYSMRSLIERYESKDYKKIIKHRN
jgi:hypothetical protein